MSKTKEITMETYIKKTPKETIHNKFVLHVRDVLSRARLSRKFYFNSMALQMAEKQNVLSDDKKSVYVLEFKDDLWQYFKRKIAVNNQ